MTPKRATRALPTIRFWSVEGMEPVQSRGRWQSNIVIANIEI